MKRVQVKSLADERGMGVPKPKTVPCLTCGEPTPFTATKKCDPCHNIERDLADYLERGGPLARDFVASELRRAERDKDNETWSLVSRISQKIGWPPSRIRQVSMLAMRDILKVEGHKELAKDVSEYIRNRGKR